jgi:hypothetical protein
MSVMAWIADPVLSARNAVDSSRSENLRDMLNPAKQYIAIPNAAQQQNAEIRHKMPEPGT